MTLQREYRDSCDRRSSPAPLHSAEGPGCFLLTTAYHLVHTGHMKDIEIGTRVCAKGRGTDSLAHWHGEVIRMTKTLIVVESQPRRIKHRFNRESLQSVPRNDWGGVRISTKCQGKV